MKYYYQKESDRWLEHYIVLDEKRDIVVTMWVNEPISGHSYASGRKWYRYDEEETSSFMPDTAKEITEQEYEAAIFVISL